MKSNTDDLDLGLPCHIRSTGTTCYHSMWDTRKDQSIDVEQAHPLPTLDLLPLLVISLAPLHNMEGSIEFNQHIRARCCKWSHWWYCFGMVMKFSHVSYPSCSAWCTLRPCCDNNVSELLETNIFLRCWIVNSHHSHLPSLLQWPSVSPIIGHLSRTLVHWLVFHLFTNWCVHSHLTRPHLHFLERALFPIKY